MAEGLVKCEGPSEDLNEPICPLECAVCLQTCVHPAELPCGHIFCFLCIKGIAFQGGRCAMCREAIPLDFLYKPKLVAPIEMENSEDVYQWYYEGYSGWWQYDQRASTEIEEAYQKGEKSCQLLLAGFLYIVDFNTMVQYRQTNPVRRRRIKRDRATTEKLGVAGLRPQSETESTSEPERHPVHIAETLIRTMEEVEMGLQRLWLQTDELDTLEQLPDLEEEPPTREGRGGVRRWFSSPTRQEGSLLVDNYGLESLGPEEYPEDLGFRAVSPSPRDGRSFNPRLELCDAGEDESDEAEEVDEEPRRIFTGACEVSPATFRPQPMRASGQDAGSATIDSNDEE